MCPSSLAAPRARGRGNEQVPLLRPLRGKCWWLIHCLATVRACPPEECRNLGDGRKIVGIIPARARWKQKGNIVTKPITGRLLVRIQPQELSPRPIRVGGFVVCRAGHEPFKGDARSEGPCNEDGLARLGRAALSCGDACARNADLLRELDLIEACGLACFTQAVG